MGTRHLSAGTLKILPVFILMRLELEEGHSRRGRDNYGAQASLSFSVLYVLLTTPLRVWENLTFKYLSVLYGLSMVWP
jgi:hypothetical protein